jgi:hypothetical protein
LAATIARISGSISATDAHGRVALGLTMRILSVVGRIAA